MPAFPTPPSNDFTAQTGLPQRIFNSGVFWFDLEQITVVRTGDTDSDGKPCTSIWTRSDTGASGAFEVQPETGEAIIKAWVDYFYFKTYNEVK